MAVATKEDIHEQVEIPAGQSPDSQPSVESSTSLVLGDRTRVRPFNSRCVTSYAQYGADPRNCFLGDNDGP